MIKEIKYNGFTETPSDYECPDGDLATVTGLVPEDEALHPVQPARNLFQLPSGYTVCFVHANASGYKHYIIRRDYTTEEGTAPDVVTHKHSDFYWLNMPDSYINYADTDQSSAGYLAWQAITTNNMIIEFTDKDIYEVNAVGNTLLFLTSVGMYYCLWKGTDGKYKNLGNHLPESYLSFGLQGKVSATSQHGIALDDVAYVMDISDTDHNSPYVFGSNGIEPITNGVLATVNSYIADLQNRQGYFIFPFYVSYAYKLYDENYIMQSSPVLMITNTSESSIYAVLEGMSEIADYRIDYLTYSIRAICHRLDYCLMNNPNLDDWKDVVKSVDIFISAPIYTYKQSGEVKGFYNVKLADYTVSRITELQYYGGTVKVANTNDHAQWTMQSFFNGQIDPYGQRVLTLPCYDKDEINDKVKNCHEFYLLKSIPVDKLQSVRTVIDIPENYLDSLVNRDRMTDDANSHDLLIPRYSFTYNSRLNIANISKGLAKPQPTICSVCYFNKTFRGLFGNDSVTWTDYGSSTYNTYLFVEQNGRNFVLKSSEESELGYTEDDMNPFLYFYFGNSNANMAVIERDSVLGSHYKIPLSKHDFLNGAVYFNKLQIDGSALELYTDAIIETFDNVVDLPNKIYTSEVNNPFVFLSAGMRTIGISEIVGIRPAVKAMSPSQYGQFKFYVFTLDGVWALEVSKEGYLQEPTLVSPDVVMGGNNNNVRSITQIDGAVLFASERGIMMLEGSTCTCISDMLNSHDPFVPFATLPANDVLPGLRSVCGDFLTTVAPVPFSTFIKDCSMLYDYPHQRIILYSASQPYAYTFSLKSKQWGMIPSTIQSTVLDYPNAMVMIKNVQNDYPVFADFSHDPDPATPGTALAAVQGLIITRPLKLDMPDVLKTVESIIQRGNFKKGHVQSVLYGSRDLQNWLLVKSSVDHYLRGFRGTPFKYFRIALLCQLDDNESIFGCSVQFTPRYQNRLR